MFLGEYTHTIDEKGRLTIPAKFRGELSTGLVVTRGFDKNLMVFPLGGWRELAERIIKRPIGEDDVRTLRRRVFSGAVDLSPDSHGRIVLPPYLRDFAGIDSEVIVAGLYNYIEVWSTEDWNEVLHTIEQSSDAARWADLGI
jgi:MraZ protein